jgi:hypothetical protein
MGLEAEDGYGLHLRAILGAGVNGPGGCPAQQPGQAFAAGVEMGAQGVDPNPALRGLGLTVPS